MAEDISLELGLSCIAAATKSCILRKPGTLAESKIERRCKFTLLTVPIKCFTNSESLV